MSNLFFRKNKGAGFEPASLADTQGAFSDCRLLWLFNLSDKSAAVKPYFALLESYLEARPRAIRPARAPRALR